MSSKNSSDKAAVKKEKPIPFPDAGGEWKHNPRGNTLTKVAAPEPVKPKTETKEESTDGSVK